MSALNTAISHKFHSILRCGHKKKKKNENEKGSLWITSFMWQSLNGFFGIITHDSFLFLFSLSFGCLLLLLPFIPPIPIKPNQKTTRNKLIENWPPRSAVGWQSNEINKNEIIIFISFLFFHYLTKKKNFGGETKGRGLKIQ